MKNPSEISLRMWLVLPLTIIFGAAVFRMIWNIPVSSFWWLAIGATVTGYFFILRFFSRPVSMERLKAPWIRVGATAGISAGLVVATVYLYSQVPASIAVISRVILRLAIFVNASGYFFLVLLIKPGIILRLKTRPVRVGVTTVITAALVCLTMHTIRFLPSPEALYIQSKVMAILLLAALIAVYPLILKYIWGVWRRDERG